MHCEIAATKHIVMLVVEQSLLLYFKRADWPILNITDGKENNRARGRRSRRSKSILDSRIPTMTLAGLVLIGIALFLYISTAHSSGDLYLYEVEGGEDHYPVVEYLVPEHESLWMVDRNDTEHLPAFLSSTNNGMRVVEYYAPWCPHCRHYKSHYIKVAKKVAVATKKLGMHVDFFAVSCTAHKNVCLNQGVHGYPSIRAYPAGSVDPTDFDAWEVHPFRILSALGIDGFELDGFDIEDDETADKSLSYSAGEPLKPRHVRNKQELYGDAFLSFDFALRNGIFMESPILTNTTEAALYEWLELLRKALPPVWKIQRTIDAIMEDFDTATANETIFLKTIEPYKPDQQEWSPACTHENGLSGYTCGLWELFHIMTVGVVEWNKQGDNKWIIISTEKAADTLRDYVAHFFGCDVCQQNFLSAYDSCAFDRCNRLKPPTDDDETESSDPTDWDQLSLWLWETHNAVNVRLLHERAEREGKTVTPQDEVDARWPSRQDCPGCWREDGTWDEEIVYKFLRISYWPDDSVTAEYRRDLASITLVEAEEIVPLSITLLPLGVLAFFAIGLYSKKVQLEKSGRHKKCEDGPTYSNAA